jgi:hypothetical protein
MTYGVRWIDAEANETHTDHLVGWERNLPPSVQARRQYEWLYRENPGGSGRLAVLESESPGERPSPVGTAGYTTRVFTMGDQVVRAAVLADQTVAGDHQTETTARTLAGELHNEVRGRHDLVYGFSPRNLERLILDLGYRKLGGTRRFAMLLRYGSRLQRKIGPPAIVAGVGLDTVRRVMVTARAASSTLQHRLDWLPDVDARFDRLWSEARHEYPMIAIRDAAFARWRFLQRPGGRLEIAALISRRTGNLDGYAAVTWLQNTAYVRDIFARREELKPLLRMLCASVARRGATSISLRLWGAPFLVDCLYDLGFSERPDHRTLVVDAGDSFTRGRPECFDPEQWYLTDVDFHVW